MKINDEMLDRLGTYFVYHLFMILMELRLKTLWSVGYEAYLTYNELYFKNSWKQEFLSIKNTYLLLNEILYSCLMML